MRHRCDDAERWRALDEDGIGAPPPERNGSALVCWITLQASRVAAEFDSLGRPHHKNSPARPLGDPPAEHAIDHRARVALFGDGAADDEDQGGHGLEVTAHPEDRGTDLLVGKWRERHAGDVVVDGCTKSST